MYTYDQPFFKNYPPLSLYIHLPWCVRKCPYCDFNSHEVRENLPQAIYVAALIDEIEHRLHFLQQRSLISIFFGGGTPSLFSAESIATIINHVRNRCTFSPNIEITLEANPGTIDQANFQAYRQAGINRLSLGIQSLQDEKLKILGRIHDRDHATEAINIAKKAGFDNFNLDIMYGLPNQSIDEALQDLQTALSFNPSHFSWYQLTIEPNTLFYRQTPSLPAADEIWEMQVAGQQLLSDVGFCQYEVSAYAREQKACLHNCNYWEFGDYLGIGAGAYSKITDMTEHQVIRFSQAKHPKDYLNKDKRQTVACQILNNNDLIFEFMLNALRLSSGVPIALFEERTGLASTAIHHLLQQAKAKLLLVDDIAKIQPTTLGQRFLNDLVSLFLVETKKY